MGKNLSSNAGLSNSLPGLAVRSALGALLIGAIWYALGWAMSSHALGWVLCATSLVGGPVLLPIILPLYLRQRGYLRRLDWASDPALAREFYKTLLRRPGPRPTVWARPSHDLSILWVEDLLSMGGRQHVIVTSHWLRQSPQARAKDWMRIWDAVAAVPRGVRRLRTLQLLLWMGALAPLELLIYGMRMALVLIGFGDLPSPAFWLQGFCWWLKSIWFGSPREFGLPPRLERPRRVQFPYVWNSLIFGVWFQLLETGSHPVWPLLTHSEAFFEGETRH